MPWRPIFILSIWSAGQKDFNIITYSSPEDPRNLSRTFISIKCERLTITNAPSLGPGRLRAEPETASVRVEDSAVKEPAV
jgi:hypothetical protein